MKRTIARTAVSLEEKSLLVCKLTAQVDELTAQLQKSKEEHRTCTNRVNENSLLVSELTTQVDELTTQLQESEDKLSIYQRLNEIHEIKVQEMNHQHSLQVLDCFVNPCVGVLLMLFRCYVDIILL